VYVVLRGMSYIGHGLSHAIFGGFAASGLVNVNYFLGAGIWGLASALMVTAVTRRRAIGSDAAIGVITTASFALGLVLIQLYGSPGRNADAVLFGNVLGVEWQDVWVVLGVALFAVTVIFFRYRALLFVTFDPEVAEAAGLRTARIDALLMLVLAASILATMSVMGVTLIAAAVVVPAATARMLTHSFARMLVLAPAIGGISGFVGMNLSYHLDIASGPTIVLTGSTLFALAFVLVSPQGGLRRQWRPLGAPGSAG
jgi:manganese/iron transport system permease protein/iron/zinc/copper transport system permease protein